MRIALNITAFAVLAIISMEVAAKDRLYYRWIDETPPVAAPQGAMVMATGNKTLAEFKGKVVLLNLWATW
ncbi:MAG: TlpA family protein disulfide reductase [Alphaproteobacteria bacterium]